MNTRLVFAVYFFCLTNCFGQMGELSKFDCNYSKEIIIPFNYSGNEPSVKPELNQVVFYNYRDQYTFWYRIEVKENETLHFLVSAIDSSDSYVVYVYQYNNTDFCNRLYNRKIKSFSGPFYVGDNRNKRIANASQTLEVQVGNVYYISILNLSLHNCGHNFNLYYGTDTLKVKALHLPCKNDITTLAVTSKANIGLKDTVPVVTAPPVIAPVIRDSVIVPVTKDIVKSSVVNTKAFNNITYIVKDESNLKVINAKLTVIDLETGDNLQLMNPSTGLWNAMAEKDKKYRLKCTSFGYNDLVMNVDITAGETIELFLKPLKVGDNMVMKSIYFHPNTYAMRSESTEELQKLLSYLLENTNIIIEIQGHTNGDNKVHKNRAYANLGEEWNFEGSAKRLSLKRAEAIKKYLINNGVGAERMKAKGYGGSKAIVANPETREDGLKNIRVEIVILKN